ncbi:MAG: TolC family protein [Magnetococcales bacterium]|nr:TolC family protein [Magnetococcales bacterium]
MSWIPLHRHLKKFEKFYKKPLLKQEINSTLFFCTGRYGKILAILTFCIVVTGCAVKQKTLTPEQRLQRMTTDLISIVSAQKPIEGKVSLQRALARTLLYNLDRRHKDMDLMLAQGLSNVTNYKMLPRLTLSGDSYYHSQLTTATEDRTQDSASLGMAWNVLDFGVSYLHARQKVNKIFIAEERRRKAAHAIVKEVRETFWRAVAAQRLKEAMVPLQIKVKLALKRAREAEEQRIQPPMKVLDFQKGLLKTLEQIQNQWRDLATAKIKLAGLMNVPLDREITLDTPEKVKSIDEHKLHSLQLLESYALLHRPELRERDYQKRIKADETKKAILRMLPGVEFNISGEYDSDSTYINDVWSESGVKLVWNLLNLISAPEKIALAKTKEEKEHLQRLAMNMTVLTQVHVSFRQFDEVKAIYETTEALSEVNDRLYQHAEASKKAAVMSEMELIRRDADRIIFQAKKDLAYAKLQNAIGDLLVSMGIDILPEDMDSMDQETLESRIAQSLTEWNMEAIFSKFDVGGNNTLIKSRGSAAMEGVATPEWIVEEADSDWQKIDKTNQPDKQGIKNEQLPPLKVEPAKGNGDDEEEIPPLEFMLEELTKELKTDTKIDQDFRQQPLIRQLFALGAAY